MGKRGLAARDSDSDPCLATVSTWAIFRKVAFPVTGASAIKRRKLTSFSMKTFKGLIHAMVQEKIKVGRRMRRAGGSGDRGMGHDKPMVASLGVKAHKVKYERKYNSRSNHD